MVKLIVLVVTLVGLFNISSGQVVQEGQCNPNTPIVNNFNIELFLGTWYELARGASPTGGADCSHIELSRNGTTNEITFYNRAINRNFLEELTGTVTSDGTARLMLNLNDAEPLEISILVTNNIGFALAHRCQNINDNQRMIYLWQLGRTPLPATEIAIGIINTTLVTEFGIDIEELDSIDHSDYACDELPVIEENQPIVLPGQCDPNITVVQNFNIEAFTGEWHELSSYYSENVVGTCARASYSLAGETINVEHNNIINQILHTTTGTVTIVSDDDSARLEVTLEVAPGVYETREMLVIATDYANYAIAYTCENLNEETKRVFSWIHGRSRHLSDTATIAVNNVVNSIFELNYAYYQDTSRTDDDCFYFPYPEPGVPVIFRGICDLSIPAMPNFELDRYLGLWHDIESYPSNNQQGSCNNAEYIWNIELETVDVLNTQVNDQTLETINGVASIASDDGSGKLVVSFLNPETNISTQTSYWVLATDYETYSLVYTCENIDENNRAVWVWKLSRTKQLLTEANTAINNVMSNIPILDQIYFELRDQSVEGCFFFPEPQPGVPVVFPGQCDDSIPVVVNFVLTQFQGRWFEIESYPTDFLHGHCVEHEFAAGTGNTLNLASNAILDQFLQIAENTVFLSSTDGSAKLVIALNNTGIQIPFWIIGTDYVDYALAYSCINLENRPDFRAIYSWKLSRTRQLSTPTNTIINNIINTVDVLDNEYYEAIGHQDEDCFFLPELPPGAPIILPGQCDPNIPVVTNFSAERYAGLWHLIESYPSDFQSGTCNDVTYTVQSDGSVLVFNTQVIDQTLDTLTGLATLTDDLAKFEVTFPDAPVPRQFWVLATNYYSYALAYSCENLSIDQRRVWSWKLSRTRTLSQEATDAINEVIDRVNVLNNRYYEDVNNSDDACFYYPEVDGNPVRFRGQCDLNIPAVADFNTIAYMGLWHDIESYPSMNQQGTCNDAYYSSNEEGINVLNTHVIDRTLHTINGVAVNGSNDGSGKLIVSFPTDADNVTSLDMNYWVLATDYISYAFVYTCYNDGLFHRQVWSWKLSRSRQLSPGADAVINAVINANPVLDQRYYLSRNQTDEGCFYFPPPQRGEPVVFRGQCDIIVPVINDFDMTRFSGPWHEIEAYPYNQLQPGECINHLYSHDGGFNAHMSTSSVDGEALLTFNSTLTFNSGDSGAHVVTFANGTTTAFWIIDTDYDEYALAYSCVNIGPDSRIVYSWKLSRSKSLSVAANTAINNTLESLQVLDNMYYEPANQTDEACFFLPELGPNDPVVFPGQCDETIAVVSNFDARRYASRWFDIESYYDDSYGNCKDGRLAVSGDGYNVFITQVLNQTLEATNRQAMFAADGSGRLIVNTDNETYEYWILDTDYETYSLVYSCKNLNAESRRVWSWKLSKTRDLTVESRTAIDAVVDTINVLSERYYIVKDHSPEACFYFPIPQRGAYVRFRGQCSETIPVVQNFDLDRYLGTWHAIESYPLQFYDGPSNGTCSTTEYSANVTSAIGVQINQIVNQQLYTLNGLSVEDSLDGSGKLLVTLPIVGTDQYTTSPYWVLATNYDSYALVYSCSPSPYDEEYVQVFSWKLSRSKQLAAADEAAVNNVMSDILVLDQRYYEVQDHSESGCFYYPEVEQGVPRVFPGQCDPNIPVISNFNLTRFEGIWHEIEIYPNDFYYGQCVNHRYTYGSDLTMDTLSVINQALLISSSTITVTDNAMLLITRADGTSIPFWIIDTDYEDYALAYSCIDRIDRPYFRSVYSWKLSRSKILSLAGDSAIDNAMTPIQVLNHAYFEPVDQADETCFFLPELSPNEPVVFVGQCDPSITAVSNFDAENYAGRWFDIESYYDGYHGDCRDSIFNVSGDGYDIVLTQVLDQTLASTSSRATFSVDGSGKLTVNTDDGVFEYLILATDYESYSLIYSCNNEDTESRRVWSWKMSRTRQLTGASHAEINNVVNAINVLDERYYNVRNNTAEGCFYFPEPVRGQTVRFRSACEDIPVVQNFELERYLGIWHDIESYPQEFQDGECATAEYTAGEGGIHVLNKQVYNQRPVTINGFAVMASEDGSAKLSVTFPGTDQDIDAPYWVLATDYVSYSLVYSCRQYDEEYVTVGVWKLSKQQNLTTEAEAVIDAVIASTTMLQSRYFEETSHTEQDCFYYPYIDPGNPIILAGQCPQDDEIDYVTEIDAAVFAGTWHEVARFSSHLQTGECASSEFERMTVESIEVDSFSWTQSIIYNERLDTVSRVVSHDGSGLISINLSGDGVNTSMNLYILGTDNSTFALVYSCNNFDDYSKQIFSWKLSRSRDGLSQESMDIIDDLISENIDLHESYYQNTDQSNDGCFYYPAFNPLPDAIILPGPCDERIQAKNNFNANAYAGRWFEMEKYNQPFQSGTCTQVQYSISDNEIVVFNSEVIDQTLVSMTGSATAASNDGSGLLNVTFVVDGVPLYANYYILETDYTSFSLVYSCRNLNNGSRQVSSWKLSRTATLSDEANNIIDEIVNDVQGLIQDYYVPTSQLDADCFYIPEFDENHAPVFRGECDDVNGIPAFNMQQYLGWWHEIERYSLDDDIGECISSDFALVGSAYRVVDTGVDGISSNVRNSTVTATTDGRLRRLYDDGTYVDSVVLETDYQSYSLLYSCETFLDENEDFRRRVWSAKHSRTRELSQTANNNMNTVIDDIPVLNQDLYMTVDQSDSTCFHYPHPTLIRDRVILRGQCDTNIPVMNNINVTAYTGDWYQVEKYPYPEATEDSSCIGTRYTLNPQTQYMTVLNWERVDGELITVQGFASFPEDGRGVLTINLPVGPNNETIASQLLVLETDYTSYSLLYFCENVNELQRAISAFKLSRTRTLTPAAAAAINVIINARDELYQPYFVPVEHDDECEDPSAGAIVKSSVIVIVICSIWQLLNSF